MRTRNEIEKGDEVPLEVIVELLLDIPELLQKDNK